MDSELSDDGDMTDKSIGIIMTFAAAVFVGIIVCACCCCRGKSNQVPMETQIQTGM